MKRRIRHRRARPNKRINFTHSRLLAFCFPGGRRRNTIRDQMSLPRANQNFSTKANNLKDKKSNASHLGFEATLWATADKLRGNLDAAEYKHVVLGLIFLKYISDAFEEKHAALQKEKGADPEDLSRRKCFLGTARSALVLHQRPRQRPAHRQATRQRHDRHRA